MDYSQKKSYILKANKKLVDELIALNHNNRNLRRDHIAWLKAAIKTNQFLLTGQGISVSKEGVLIDGQHRLMAIREAGYPAVDILVVTGLDEKAKIYIDQHARRSPSDMLKLVLDRAISPKMAAIIKAHLGYKETIEGFIIQRSRASLEDLVAATDKNSALIEDLMEAGGNKLRTGVMLALFHYAKRVSKDDAIDLASKIRAGTNLAAASPAYKLREFILNQRGSWGHSDVFRDYGFAVTVCVADANGAKVTKLHQAKSWDGLPKKK